MDKKIIFIRNYALINWCSKYFWQRLQLFTGNSERDRILYLLDMILENCMRLDNIWLLINKIQFETKEHEFSMN